MSKLLAIGFILVFCIQSQAKDVFGYYCQNKKQVRELKEVVEVEILRPQKGLSLEESQKRFQLYKNGAREIARNFFNVGADTDEPEENRIDPSIQLADGSDGEDKPSDQILSPQMDKYIFRVNGKTIQLKPHYLQSFENVRELVHNYTFAIPINIQKKIYPNVKIGDDYPTECEEGDNGYTGFDNECRFSSERAMQDRYRAWQYYFKKHHKVEESPGSSPNKLKFLISLDLNLFCAYGMPVNDLKSK